MQKKLFLLAPSKLISMNLKQHLKEKNIFLYKAYETAYAYSPSSPLSVKINPKELGKSIGFEDIQTKRIMMELVNDGFVQSTLGMSELMITSFGLRYLSEIEEEPMETSFDHDNESINKPTDSKFMKQSEKLDLILRELYKYRNDGKYYSIAQVCETLSIPIASASEINTLAHRLKEDRYINATFVLNDCNAALTTHGIEYVEEDSYSYSGHSVITNNYSISIVNSPNSNIISQSSNVTITQNYFEASNAIERIREHIALDESIDKLKASEILECLNEIQDNLENNKKPKFAIKSLIDVAGGISSISSWLTTLGQFAGLIPPL